MRILKKLTEKIIKIPVKLVIGFRDFIWYVAESLHFSIRKKITFDFLFLYIIFSAFSIGIVAILFIYLNVDYFSEEINEEATKIVYEYGRRQLNHQELVERFERLSEEYQVSLTLIDNRNKDRGELVKTQLFTKLDYPSLFYEKGLYLFSHGVVVRRPYYYDDYILYQMHNYNKYTDSTDILIMLMGATGAITFLLLSVLGGRRIRSILSPIYKMTRTAETISINNMNERLDVQSTKYELRDLAMTLNDMLDRLNKDYNRQKRFVSDVSHELRTPISIINGYGNMLERWGKKDEAVLKEGIDAILDESKNMEVLVENLLTLVRSDNQTLSFSKKLSSISQMAFNACKEVVMVDDSRHQIAQRIEDDVWAVVDAGKTKQAFRILVDNALKYTPVGRQITIFCYQEGENVCLGVEDQGMGIPKEDLPHLFERFYRSDKSRSRDTGGHGLGLAIAKALVTGQRGKIKVRSSLQRGSQFTMIFPKKG